MQLQGTQVLLTGASRGIGKALAIGLAKAGSSLLLTALETGELREVATRIREQTGASVAVFPADLTDEHAREDLLRWASQQDAPIDMLINNAGAGAFGKFASTRPASTDAILSLNIAAPLHLTHGLLPSLCDRPHAKIVFISSAIARLPYPGLAAYGGTKGFLSSFSESLTCELDGSSVSVLCFHPAFTDTHFMPSAGMRMERIPQTFIQNPGRVAARIIRAIEKDKTWAYADAATAAAVWLGIALPARLKAYLFRHSYWRLPDEKDTSPTRAAGHRRRDSGQLRLLVHDKVRRILGRRSAGSQHDREIERNGGGHPK